MKSRNKEFILYGLNELEETIGGIITDLDAFDYYFEIRLILTEALTNAFIHGNKGDMDKPIYVRYAYDDTKVSFEIEDSGNGYNGVTIPEQLSDKNLLNDSGRGLFLIKCVADKIELNNNIIIIQKSINKGNSKLGKVD